MNKDKRRVKERNQLLRIRGSGVAFSLVISIRDI